LAEKGGFSRKDRTLHVLHGSAKAGSVTAKAIKSGSKGGTTILFLFFGEGVPASAEAAVDSG